MSRFNQVSRLKHEVDRLFDTGLDEETISTQLHANPRFVDATQSEIESYYERLQEKVELEEMYERKTAELDITNEQAVIEIKHIENCRQNAEKHLLHDGIAVNDINLERIWQSRFVLSMENSDKNDKFNMLDLFQCESKACKIKAFNNVQAIYALTYPFILIVERISDADVCCLHLVKFNPDINSLQTIQSIECNCFYEVLTDSSNPSNFVLDMRGSILPCKLTHGKIQTDKRIDLELTPHALYSDGKLYEVETFEDWDEILGDFWEVSVSIYNNNAKKDFLAFNSFPQNLTCNGFSFQQNCFALQRDRLFVSIQFHLSEDYGIIFTELQKEDWTIIDFMTSFSIDSIRFSNDQNLMIHARKENKEISKIYKLPICKPDSLRNMAWFKIVNLFKQAKIENPYNEARRYLPLNSDIQSFVFTEE